MLILSQERELAALETAMTDVPDQHEEQTETADDDDTDYDGSTIEEQPEETPDPNADPNRGGE